MPDIASTNFSETDASNNAASPNGAPEGMAPSGVNDVIRATMGAVKRWHDQVSPTVVSGGTANVQTLTHGVGKTALVTGDLFGFIVGITNTGATTLNVDGLGAKNIFIGASAALIGGELQIGQLAFVGYDGVHFQLLSPGILGVAQGGTGQSQGVPSLMQVGSTGGSDVSAGVTVFLGPVGGNSTEGRVAFPMSFAGTIRNMFTVGSAFAGAGQSFVYTLRKNNVSQTLTVTVTGAAANTGNDTTHSVTFAAGDVIDVQLVTSAAAGVGGHLVSCEIDKTP